MGLQIVIDADDFSEAVRALEAGGVVCEKFPMSCDQIGISISTDVFDSVGELAMTNILSAFTYVDLWSGETHEGRRE
jgi:hypothetical protein